MIDQSAVVGSAKMTDEVLPLNAVRDGQVLQPDEALETILASPLDRQRVADRKLRDHTGFEAELLGIPGILEGSRQAVRRVRGAGEELDCSGLPVAQDRERRLIN